MKTLSVASILLAVLSLAGIANADTLTDRCSGISTFNQKVIVLVYRGPDATAHQADALIIVSETNKGRRIYAARITAGTDVSQVLTSGSNAGMKLTIHDAGPGYLWLGEGGESFALTCQSR